MSRPGDANWPLVELLLLLVRGVDPDPRSVERDHSIMVSVSARATPRSRLSGVTNRPPTWSQLTSRRPGQGGARDAAGLEDASVLAARLGDPRGAIRTLREPGVDEPVEVTRLRRHPQLPRDCRCQGGNDEGVIRSCAADHHVGHGGSEPCPNADERQSGVEAGRRLVRARWRLAHPAGA